MPAKTPRKEETAAWGLDELREILDLIDERGIGEFEMETNGFRVRIRRGAAFEAASRHDAASDSAKPLPVVVVGPRATDSKAAPAAGPPSVEAPEIPSQGAEELHIIKSPIVGTFYASSGPDAPPFVKAGDTVRPGQVLCIIEAMKLMNEIEAEIAGEITRIFVENGQPVEYGQSLFGIIPSNPASPQP